MPALVMSAKVAPASVETSSTPPSKWPPESLKSQLFLNVNCAAAVVIAIDGLSRRLSRTLFGLVENASLGAVSGDVVEVTHNGAPVTFVPCVAVQPAGRAG